MAQDIDPKDQDAWADVVVFADQEHKAVVDILSK